MNLTLLVPQLIYFGASLILILFMYMIARFYRRKLDSKAMSIGFLVAMIALGIAMVSSITSTGENVIGAMVKRVSILVAGLATLWNVAMIYHSMKQVHK